MIGWIIIIVALVTVDQVTKLMAVRLIGPGGSVDVIPNIFRFTYVENRGAAFGMLDSHRWVFMVISTLAIIGLLIYLFKFAGSNKLLHTGLALVIGGGIGNMIDRVAYGYVVDFLDFCAFPNVWIWVFNVADACVCIGVGLIALYLIIDIIKDAKKVKENEQSEG